MIKKYKLKSRTPLDNAAKNSIVQAIPAIVGRERREKKNAMPLYIKKPFFSRLKTRFLFKILVNQPLTSTENKAPLSTGETEPTALSKRSLCFLLTARVACCSLYPGLPTLQLPAHPCCCLSRTQGKIILPLTWLLTKGCATRVFSSYVGMP